MEFTTQKADINSENGAIGKARMDRRTKRLVQRLEPGDIAVIDHPDIDHVSAESLIEVRPLLIINSACSATGRYPNLGPLAIVAAGIPIIDEAGEQLFEKLEEGDTLCVKGNSVFREEELVTKGALLTLEELELRIEESKRRLGKHLSDFAANTVELLETEKEILLEQVELPNISTSFRGRHTLIVVRGHDYKQDLKALRSYIREMKPVIVAVDGGADALLETKLKPDMIVGDFDSISDEALSCGAELVVHGYPDGRAPGKRRLDEMGTKSTVFHYPGTSEDVAMLIAFEKGTELISVVGGHSNLIDFLDKDRKGMASTFLVRLRVGSVLVDAKGVSKLYQTRVKSWHLALLLTVALVLLVLLVILSDPLRQFFSVLSMRFQIWIMRIQRLI